MQIDESQNQKYAKVVYSFLEEDLGRYKDKMTVLLIKFTMKKYLAGTI